MATVIQVANLLRFQLDNFVIAKLVGFAPVAVYSIAARIVNNWIFPLVISSTRVLDPRLARLDGAGKKEELQKLFVRTLTVSATLAFGLATVAFVCGGKFIVRWVGEDFVDSIPVLWILVGAYADKILKQLEPREEE